MATRAKKIGPYEVEGEIGAGGMANVMRARQPALQRTVAIKRLNKAFMDDATMAARFEREAVTMANLAHENIVHIYDFIQRASGHFIVMEFVDGIDVRQLIAGNKALPADVAGLIALPCARALDHAHYHGIVHRDFKPGNIMVTHDGEVKLMDFGIAHDDDGEDLTRTGQALGTPAYMSPEQIMGKRIEPASDLFSFGVVLYEMLTGERPFHAPEDGGTVMESILDGRYTKARTLNPKIPWRLNAIIDRCLRVDPKRRFRTTEDLVRALEDYVGRSTPADPRQRLMHYLDAAEAGTADAWVVPRTRDKPRGLAVVALLVAVGLGWLLSNGLARRPGYVRVEGPKDAIVLIDGQRASHWAPGVAIPLPPGVHQVELRQGEMAPLVKRIEVSPGDTSQVRFGGNP